MLGSVLEQQEKMLLKKIGDKIAELNKTIEKKRKLHLKCYKQIAKITFLEIVEELIHEKKLTAQAIDYAKELSNDAESYLPIGKDGKRYTPLLLFKDNIKQYYPDSKVPQRFFTKNRSNKNPASHKPLTIKSLRPQSATSIASIINQLKTLVAYYEELSTTHKTTQPTLVTTNKMKSSLQDYMDECGAVEIMGGIEPALQSLSNKR